LPGSVVDLRIVKQKKDFIEAHIFHIHKHDPKLVDGKVFCPHFFRMEEEEESKIVQDGTKSNKVEENEGRSEE
jgi:tRNA/tmRNA/rRNA uracil-C5-methylase (TrmA/RlmC/RlmD family)